jgi:hypothetical protein
VTKTKSPFTLRAVMLAAAGVLLPTACATPTPFAPLGSAQVQGGYSEQRIEGDRYRVMFAGNEFTSRMRVENYLLYRSAQLTLQQGFDGFTMVTRETDPNVRTTVMQNPFEFGQSAFWGPSWRYRRGGFGWGNWDPWGGSPFWSNNLDVQTVTSYEASAEILMFSGQRMQDPTTFDARHVIESLQASIEMPR